MVRRGKSMCGKELPDVVSNAEGGCDHLTLEQDLAKETLLWLILKHSLTGG